MKRTWSEAFKAHINKRFGHGAQLKAALSLGISQSKVSYWCRGSRAREATRLWIESWSDGEVVRDLPRGGDRK